MSNLSQVLTPGGGNALVDSYLTILRGDIRPSRTVVVEGKSVDVPEGCRFRFILPPDKKALRYQQLGRPRIDKKNNYCEAAFLVGVPVAYAGDPKYGTKTTLMNQGYQSSAGYFKNVVAGPSRLAGNLGSGKHLVGLAGSTVLCYL
jgi:hypothetical protein